MKSAKNKSTHPSPSVEGAKRRTRSTEGGHNGRSRIAIDGSDNWFQQVYPEPTVRRGMVGDGSSVAEMPASKIDRC